MPMHTYTCDNCGNSEYRNIYQEEDLSWAELCFIKGATKAQLAKMDFAKGDDPRTLEVWEVVNYGDGIPDKVKCNKCKKKKAMFNPPDLPNIKSGRNSYAAKRERQRYARDGMDKKQAEQFYKESVEASKERVKSNGAVSEHYKRVVPNYKDLHKQGHVKRLTDQESSDKVKYLKDANVSLSKEGRIGRKPRK